MIRSAPFILCLLLSCLSTQAFSQKVPPVLKQNLDSSLREYLKEQIPHHFCPCNNCEHCYNGKLKITKMGQKTRLVTETQKEKRLVVWGLAGADQYSPFGSSQATVLVYAEYLTIKGEYQLTLLKWKQSDCMKYQILMNNPLDKIEDDLDKMEDEVIGWAMDAEEELDTPQELANPGDEDEQEGVVLDWALDATEGNLDENETWEEIPIEDLAFDTEPDVDETKQENFLTEVVPSLDEIGGEETIGLESEEIALEEMAHSPESDVMSRKSEPLLSDLGNLKQKLKDHAAADIDEEAEVQIDETIMIAESEEPGEEEVIMLSELLAQDSTRAQLPVEESNEELLKEDIASLDDLIEESDPTSQNTLIAKAVPDPTTDAVDDPSAGLTIQAELALPDKKTLKKQAQARILNITVNNPTAVKFKDAVITVAYFTKTNTMLRTDSHTIYEFINAESDTGLSLIVDYPEHADQFEIQLQKVIPVEENKK